MQAMNQMQKLIIVSVNLLILAELTFAVFRSAQGPVDDAAAIFLRHFVPAVITTIVVGRVAIRKSRPKG
jgi:hypothetical protein